MYDCPVIPAVIILINKEILSAVNNGCHCQATRAAKTGVTHCQATPATNNDDFDVTLENIKVRNAIIKQFINVLILILLCKHLILHKHANYPGSERKNK